MSSESSSLKALLKCLCKINYPTDTPFRHDFTRSYATKLLTYNTQYLEMRDIKDKLLSTIGSLEAQRYTKGKRYHYIEPEVEEDKLMTSILRATSLEGMP